MSPDDELTPLEESVENHLYGFACRSRADAIGEATDRVTRLRTSYEASARMYEHENDERTASEKRAVASALGDLTSMLTNSRDVWARRAEAADEWTRG